VLPGAVKVRRVEQKHQSADSCRGRRPALRGHRPGASLQKATMRYTRIEADCFSEKGRRLPWKCGDVGVAGICLGNERRYGLRLPFSGTSEEFRPALALFTVTVTLEIREQARAA